MHRCAAALSPSNWAAHQAIFIEAHDAKLPPVSAGGSQLSRVIATDVSLRMKRMRFAPDDRRRYPVRFEAFGGACELFEKFTVIPSIDLKNGEVVRLLRGAMDQATVYGSDPAAVARDFERQGERSSMSKTSMADCRRAEKSRRHPCHSRGGAMRARRERRSGTMDSIRAVIEAGATRVSIGSAAFLNPALLREACAALPGKIFGSLDARDGKLAIKGWVETSALTIADAAQRFRDRELRRRLLPTSRRRY